MSDQLSADLASLRIARDAPVRRPWGKWLAILIGLGAVAGAVYLAVPYSEARLFKTEIQVTEIGTVSPAQASIDLTSTGYVVPQVLAKVGAKVTGRVLKAKIKEGDTVKAGDIIFEMDASDQRSQLATAQARVMAAQARAQTARANLADITQQHEREKKLAASGSVGQSTVDDLAAKVASSEAQVKAADADTAAANADVAALSVGVGNFTIAAPISGTAVTKPAEVGDVVTPASTLVELADFASLLVETDVPEGRLRVVKEKGKCQVVLDAYPDQRYDAEVVSVSPRINRAKATGTVKVRLTEDAKDIRPEMAARVSFLSKPIDPALKNVPDKVVVPASAVVDRNGTKVVFIITDGKVHATPVTLGDPVGTGFELKDGQPPAGTHVVNNPPATLADGQTIKEATGEKS